MVDVDNIGYGKVTGRFIYDVTDSPDPDTTPDFKAMSGTVTFTATVPKMVNLGATPDPVIIGRRPIIGRLDENGYLCTVNSEDGSVMVPGVDLIATDDVDLLPTGWSWQVSYNLKADDVAVSSFAPHNIVLPAGTTQDLSNYIPVPPTVPVSESQIALLTAQAIEGLNDQIIDANIASGHLNFEKRSGDTFDVGQVVGPTPNLTIGSVGVGVADANFSGTPEDPVLNMTFPAASWNATGLSTADLNTITTPGLYMQNTGASATVARNYPRDAVTGTLEVFWFGTTQHTLQRFTVWNHTSGSVRGIWLRRQISGTWQAWVFIPSVRIDTTGGRVAKYMWDDVALVDRLMGPIEGSGSPEGVVTAPVGTEYIDTTKAFGAVRWRKNSGTGNTGWIVVDGDTGWRTITSWDVSGVVTGQALSASWKPANASQGNIRVKRTAQGLFVYAQYLERVDTTNINVWASYSLPVGWRPSTVTLVSIATSNLPYSTALMLSEIGVLSRGTGAAAGANGIITYCNMYSDTQGMPWPTSLIGS